VRERETLLAALQDKEETVEDLKQSLAKKSNHVRKLKERLRAAFKSREHALHESEVTSRETAELQTQLHKLLEYYENKLEEVSERNNAFEVRDKTGRNEPYSVEMRELVMRLQSRNVADGHICDVITDVCTNFGLNIRAEDLPSERSLRRFAQEHGALASVQIAREISLPGNQGALGLAHDGTQLGQDKLLGNTLVGRQSNLCLGVAPIYANTAQG
jgi:hypothetical protein